MTPSASAAPTSGKKPNDTFISSQVNDRTTIGVNVLTGNLLLQQQDVSIKGVGQDLNVVRSYNSGEAGNVQSADNSFGYGWSANTGEFIRLEQTTAGASSPINFMPGDGSSFLFTPTSGGDYETPNQIDADLHKNADGTYLLTYRESQKKFRFSSTGALLSITDRNNNAITYNAGGYSRNATDTQGRQWSLQAGSTDELLKWGDGYSRQWSYEKAANLEVQSPEDARPDRLVKYTDPEGGIYGYESGGESHLISRVTTPGGRGADVTYGSPARVTKLRLLTNLSTGAGQDFDFAYNQTDSRCANGSMTTGVTKVTDARGNVTSYCRDIAGANGVVTDVIDPLGNHQSRTFNTQGRITAQGTGSALTNTTFNANGTLSTSQQPAGEKTSASYTGTGAAQYQPSQIADPNGKSQFFSYDANGNMTSAADTSDPANANNKATLTYNPDGTIATAKDGENRQTTYGYWGTADGTKKGYLKTITRPTVLPPMTQPAVQTLNYDGLGHVSAYTDGRGKTTTYAYDMLDRVKVITFANGSTMTYSYDSDGNQTQRVDSTGGTYTYAYDKLNRRIQEGLPGSRTVNYTYDAVGNLRTLQDGATTTLYDHDAASRVCFTATTTSTTGTCASPPAGATTFVYDGRNNRTATNFPNGVTVAQTFDTSNKLKTVQAKKGATLINDRTYNFPSYGGGLTGDLLSSMTSNALLRTWAFTYDSAKRLLTSGTNVASGWLTSTMTYDKAGNRTSRSNYLSESEDEGPRGADYAAFNAANQLCWTNPGSAPSTPCGSTPPSSYGKAFTYDAAGNDLTFAYNDRNQTISGGGTLGYAGPNQFELVTDGSSTIENNQLGIGRKITGSSTTAYTRDPDGTLLYKTLPSGAKQYYVLDAQGSVISTTDASGNAVDTYTYDPVSGGEENAVQPADFGFTGSYLRGGSQPLYKNGLRWYSPSTGRWTQPDSLDQPSDLQNANPYVYVGGNPVNYVDPTGQFLKGLRNRLSKCGKQGLKDGAAAAAGGAVTGYLLGEPFGPVGSRAAATGGAAVGFIGGGVAGCVKGLFGL